MSWFIALRRNIQYRIDWFVNKFKIVNWNTIAIFGKNKTINRSYIFLFIVPVIAKFLSKINPDVSITIGGYKFELLFDLPFSWKLLFLSALMFSIGSLLYNLFAPSIIKENKSFGEFVAERKTNYHMAEYLTELNLGEKYIERELQVSIIDGIGTPIFEQGILKLKDKLKSINFYRIEEYADLFKEVERYNTLSKATGAKYDFDSNMNRYTSLFAKTYSYASRSNSLMLLITFFVYLSGILLLAVLLYSNFISVFF